MFYFLEDFDISNYADDSTTYNPDKNVEFVFNNLEQSSSILFGWLKDNYMKVNTGKSYLQDSGNVSATAKIDKNYTESEKEQVLFWITIDSNLTFENHINYICIRARQKLNTLARAALYMNIQKKNNYEIFWNVSVWIPSINLDFQSRRPNNKITFIHERALEITYQELLNKDNSV